MSNRNILVFAALVLASLSFVSQADAGYWQNLKNQLTSSAAAPPVQQNRPPAVTSVRG